MIALEENFRSVPGIVGFVDASVGERARAAGEGRGAERLRGGVSGAAGRAANRHPERSEGPAPQAPETGQPGPSVATLPRDDSKEDRKPLDETIAPSATPVELLIVDGADDLKVDDIREIEAAAIARRMRELAAAGARWRDMAVLLTAWGSLGTYEAAFEAAGIPTYALLAEGFYERREVWDLVLALETVRDPQDDRALLGFLRSPFVGVKDETLLDLVRQTTRPVWSRIGKARVAEQELLDFGICLIRDHAALRDRVPIHELLASLLDQSGYLAHLVALGDSGRQPLANVRKFLRIAREFRDGNVGDFLRATREAKQREDPESDERLYGKHEDVVTITSVHSAKGLEWPIVFWADIARLPRLLDNQPILIGREMLALKDPDTEEKPPAWIDAGGAGEGGGDGRAEAALVRRGDAGAWIG